MNTLYLRSGWNGYIINFWKVLRENGCNNNLYINIVLYYIICNIGSFLFSQLEENIDKCLNEQRVLISEREKLISIIEKGNDELKRLEAESTEFYKQYPDYCGSDDNNNDGVRSSVSTF